jgi:N6-L-threonylcarbamoyladenine synthase
VGVAGAKALAWSLGKPLIDVDHVRAHLYAAALNADPIAFPALGMVVSGGHSNLYAMASPLEMTLIGRTIDDAIGEAYDKVAAILGLGFPGGPLVDRIARAGNDRAVDFPRSLLSPESLDFSFSGLKTAVLYEVRGVPQGKGAWSHHAREAADLTDARKADVAASFQRAAVDTVMTKLERAARKMAADGTPPASLVVGGGVSANSRLRQSCVDFGARRGVAVRLPAMSFCVDNAAMIAGLAHHRFMAGHAAGLDLEAIATASL